MHSDTWQQSDVHNSDRPGHERKISDNKKFTNFRTFFRTNILENMGPEHSMYAKFLKT